MSLTRYFAILGVDGRNDDERIEAALAAAAERLGAQTVQLRTDRMVVAYCGDALLCQEPHRSLLILGYAFSSPGAERAQYLAGNHCKRIWDSEGRDLVHSLWGRFVAFVDDARFPSSAVIREPSAGLPCYHYVRDGLIHIASDIELLIDCAGLIPDIDRIEVVGHLLFNQLRRARTCLVDVDELLGGYRLKAEAGSPRIDQIWSPWTFADRTAQITDWEEASARLRETVLGCITSLASPFSSVLLSLSGGLDSSIVAACLGIANPTLTCLTMATEEANGDERAFARLAAQAAGAPLVEAFETEEWINFERCDAAHLPRPIARAFGQSIDRAAGDLADRVGADAYFGGAGGDNVFCFLQSAAPIADCLLDGRMVQAWRTARDIGDLAGESAVNAMRKGMVRAWARNAEFRWKADPSFLAASTLDLAPQLRQHPWLVAPRHALPGKAGHIASLMTIQNHLEGFARERSRPVIAPLLAQPIVELCLRIPSWMWCRDGRDRSIARDAFRDLIPKPILDRRAKGTPESFVARLFESTRSRIGDMLLSGELARADMLDRAAIETMLRSPGPVQGAKFVRIMKILDVEMWLRSQMAQMITRSKAVHSQP